MAKRKQKTAPGYDTWVKFNCCEVCTSSAVQEVRSEGLQAKRFGPQLFAVIASQDDVHQILDACGFHTRQESCEPRAQYVLKPARAGIA